MMVSFEDGHSEGNIVSTVVSTFRVSSGMDSEGSFSTIGALANHKDGPTRFSTGGGLDKIF